MSDAPIGCRVDGLKLTTGSHGRTDLHGRWLGGGRHHHLLDEILDHLLEWAVLTQGASNVGDGRFDPAVHPFGQRGHDGLAVAEVSVYVADSDLGRCSWSR
jgi:hypothetical protein